MCHLTRQRSRYLFCTLHNDRVPCRSRINLTWIYSPFLVLYVFITRFVLLTLWVLRDIAYLVKHLSTNLNLYWRITSTPSHLLWLGYSPRLNYLASIMRLVCRYIPIGLCILSMFSSLPCSPCHTVVGAACDYLLFLYLIRYWAYLCGLPYLYHDISILYLLVVVYWYYAQTFSGCFIHFVHLFLVVVDSINLFIYNH